MRKVTFSRLNIVTMLCCVWIPCIAVNAAVPEMISYQGYLTDSGGSPVEGSVPITFRLYTVPTGGAPLWSQTKTLVVDSGLFSVELASVTGNVFPNGLFDTPLFVGLSVGTDNEMTPRRALSSAAFSLRADNANLVGGRTAQQLDQSAHVANTANPHNVTAAQTGAVTSSTLNTHTANASAHHTRYANSEAVAAVLAADGPGSGLDADTLDGVQGSVFSSGITQLGVDVSGLGANITNLQSQIVPNTGGNFTGNVTVQGLMGVGTSAPAAKLHIVNPVSTTEAIRVQGSNTWLGFWDGASYDGFLWNNFGTIVLGSSNTNSSGSLAFYTLGQERMRITAAGRTGVGVAAPFYKLHVEDPGVAIYGRSTTNYGLYGYSDNQIGIYGYSNAAGSAGIFGQSPYIGVEGITSFGATNGARQGVRGDNHGSASGWAGYFFGNVGVSGTLSKGAGAFKIDHPLDPENKYLYHSFVESPDMKNIYDGVVTTDASGLAEVSLPDWFDSLNSDFRYQLTVIGQFAQAIVTKKMQNNHFGIATSEPNVEVSWQVTGIRKDAYAQLHRIPVEENKPDDQVGKFLHPDAFGRSLEVAVDYKDRSNFELHKTQERK